MNYKISALIQKRFLIYSLLLHGGIGVTFAFFNNDEAKEKLDENKVKIIEIDVSAPKPEDSIIAETFSEDDIQHELNSIIEFNEPQTNETRLRRAELKEKKKALEAKRINEIKAKEKKIKERKRLQKIKQEKAKAAKEKAAKEKLKIENKKKIERKNKLEKERLAKIKKEKDRLNKMEQDKIAKAKEKSKAKANSKPKRLSKDKWLETSDGQSSYHLYGSSVMSKIQNRWIRPVEALSGWSCELEITQTNKGRISNIKKVKCNPNNKKFYNSVYKAVMESSPLPLPTDDRLFDKKIKITFTVE